MERIQQSISTVDAVLKDVIANPYVSASIAIFFIVFAGLAAPQLPKSVAMLFDLTLFRILILVGILIINRYNPTVAVIIAVAFFITLEVISKYQLNDFMANVSRYKKYLTAKKEKNEKDEKDEKDDDSEQGKTEQKQTEQQGDAQIPVSVVGQTGPTSEVSGLATRTTNFDTAQGLGPIQGYDGKLLGATF